MDLRPLSRRGAVFFAKHADLVDSVVVIGYELATAIEYAIMFDQGFMDPSDRGRLTRHVRNEVFRRYPEYFLAPLRALDEAIRNDGEIEGELWRDPVRGCIAQILSANEIRPWEDYEFCTDLRRCAGRLSRLLDCERADLYQLLLSGYSLDAFPPN